jgi:hypothetical protein
VDPGRTIRAVSVFRFESNIVLLVLDSLFRLTYRRVFRGWTSMKWRDVIVGAVVTLLITIVAGVVVWYLTREPATSESLTYSEQSLASLNAEKTKINIIVIRISNQGNRAARDVVAIAKFDKDSEITEAQLSSSGGPSPTIQKSISPDNRQLNIETKTLAPNEILSATLLVNGESFSRPEIGVRSDETIGAEVEPSEANITRRTNGISKNIAIAVPVIALLLQGGILLFREQIEALIGPRFLNRFSSYDENENNVAFILAHKQLADEAERILSDKIFNRASGPFELANYGLALGLQHKPEYEKYFEAENWGDLKASKQGKRLKAVIEFNRAVVAVSFDRFDQVEDHLSRALGFDPQEVIKYCAMSDYIQRALKNNEKLAQLLNERGNNAGKLSPI